MKVFQRHPVMFVYTAAYGRLYKQLEMSRV